MAELKRHKDVPKERVSEGGTAILVLHQCLEPVI
ncbi:hypothetical protein C7436_2877 [Marinobacter nauticus]|nr:hypothetical protein C7436_2877 [Marinobacter nauticus]